MAGVQSFLFNTGESFPRLNEIAKRYENRPGGYTRIHLMGHRKSDHAPRAILELVDNPTDVKLDITARAMAHEADILLRRAQKNVTLTELSSLLAAQASIPLEHDERFAPLTRRNIAKLIRYRGEEARQELTAKATTYLERIRAQQIVEGTHRVDKERWDAMELARPSRGRILTRPTTGRRVFAGELAPEREAEVGTRVEVRKPMHRRDRTTAPSRVVTVKKPSVVRLSKGIFAKRYVRRAATPSS